MKNTASSLSVKVKMPPVKTVCVPRYGSQLDPSQSRQCEVELRSTCSQGEGDKGGKRRGKAAKRQSADILKVKFPMYGRLNLSKTAREERKTPGRWMLESGVERTKRSESTGGKTGAGIDSGPVSGDVFMFSESSDRNEETNEKDKPKLAVLRTISRMLEENQIIRQRLASLGQANCVHTD